MPSRRDPIPNEPDIKVLPAMNDAVHNVDAGEIAKFEALAARWWDPHSEFKPLHDINPLRLDYIDRLAGVAGKQVIDVGCGGGVAR